MKVGRSNSFASGNGEKSGELRQLRHGKVDRVDSADRGRSVLTG